MELGELNQKELIKALSIKYNKSVAEIEKIVYSQAHFTTAKAKELAESIRWPYFGVFKLNKSRLKKHKEKYEKINE
jgi:hypothetical protein